MLRVVLVHPQIPPNTGNIARTCAATETELHLVGSLGFELSDRYLKRAGLDYWPYVNLQYHPNLETFETLYQSLGGRLLGYSIHGTTTYTGCTHKSNDWLVFGSETNGLPKPFLQRCDATLCIPMPHPQVRSLNLAVSVAIALFEARRQLNL